MSHPARKNSEDDIWPWVIIGAIYGAVTLALWAMLLWQGLREMG